MTLRLKALALLGLLTLAPVRAGAQAAAMSEQVKGSGGAAVGIWAATLTPGDILVLSLARSSPVREAGISFAGKEITLRPDESGGPPRAFIGLDLGLESGTQSLRVVFRYRDGSSGTVLKSLRVTRRQFRLKHITLPDEFIEPPPEVLDRIAREAKRLAAIYSESGPAWLGQGRFGLPHQGPMADNFGERRILNGRKQSVHTGLDIDAEMGDPISASNAGRVVLADDLYYSGNTVILDHGLGVFTVYLHMSKLLVLAGDPVSRGAVLGEAGSTGRSAGPHLHWAAKVSGSRVDPQALLGLPLDSR